MGKKKGFATQNPLIVADKNVVLTTLLFRETNLLVLHVIECCMSVCFFPHPENPAFEHLLTSRWAFCKLKEKVCFYFCCFCRSGGWRY